MTGPSRKDTSGEYDNGDDVIAAHRNDDRWRCVDCHDEWPCPVFRRRLLTLYQRDPDKLATYLRHFRDRAAADLPDLATAQLDERFLGWVSDPPLDRRLRPV